MSKKKHSVLGMAALDLPQQVQEQQFQQIRAARRNRSQKHT